MELPDSVAVGLCVPVPCGTSGDLAARSSGSHAEADHLILGLALPALLSADGAVAKWLETGVVGLP
eukprot:2060771-Amphidinium_carterae.1